MTDSEVSQSLSIPSVTSLIPQGYVDELLAIREQLNRGFWRVGDIANDIYALALANGWKVGKLDICVGVGVIIGKGGRSVRFYMDVSGFFPVIVRDMYPEIPFSHFAYAMKFPGDMCGEDGSVVPMWKAVLDSSQNMFEDRGIPPSVERLAVQWEHHENQLRESYHNNLVPPRPAFAEIPAFIEQVSAENIVMEGVDNPVMPDPFPSDLTLSTPDTTDERRSILMRSLVNLMSPIPSILGALSRLGMNCAKVSLIAAAVVSVRGAMEVIDGESGIYYEPEAFTDADAEGVVL